MVNNWIVNKNVIVWILSDFVKELSTIHATISGLELS